MNPSEHTPEKENAPGGTEGGEVRKEDATSMKNVQAQAELCKQLEEELDASIMRCWRICKRYGNRELISRSWELLHAGLNEYWEEAR